MQCLNERLQFMLSLGDKKQELPFSAEIKELARQYKCLPKPEIRLLLEFCEFHLGKTEKVMRVLCEYKKPDTVIRQLLDEPENSDRLIQNLLNDFAQRFPQEPQKQVMSQPKEEEETVQPFFDKLPMEIILEISFFLNPLELTQFISLKDEFSEFYKSSPGPVQLYFKRICKHLFSNEPVLPSPSVFVPIRDYIVSHPLEYSLNMRNLVQTNLRHFVWQSSPSDYRVSKEYFQSFGDFEEIFLKCPRVHFNGYYCLREKYMHRCQPTLYKPTGSYQVVHYYRYVRFFPDGSILYQISNLKLTDDQIESTLSGTNFQQDSSTMKGEYIHHKNQLNFKFFRSSTIFSFDTTMDSELMVFDTLTVQRFWLEIVDERFIVQEQYKHSKYNQKSFKYHRFEPFVKELPPNLQRCSL